MGQLDDELVAQARVDPMRLHEEYRDYAAVLATWNSRYADAVGAAMRAETYRKRVEAEVYISTRARLEMEGRGRVTEALIEAQVRSDPAYLAAKEGEARAESERVRLYGAVDSMRAKRDMLVGLGAHLRAEMEGDPRIRERSRVDGEVSRAQEAARRLGADARGAEVAGQLGARQAPKGSGEDFD